jgi:hypothetical protein
MIRAADDFEAIRARRDELYREQDAAISGEPDPLPAEWLTPEAAERRQSHQWFTAQQTDELAKLLGHPALADPLAPGPRRAIQSPGQWRGRPRSRLRLPEADSG